MGVSITKYHKPVAVSDIDGGTIYFKDGANNTRQLFIDSPFMVVKDIDVPYDTTTYFAVINDSIKTLYIRHDKTYSIVENKSNLLMDMGTIDFSHLIPETELIGFEIYDHKVYSLLMDKAQTHVLSYDVNDNRTRPGYLVKKKLDFTPEAMMAKYVADKDVQIRNYAVYLFDGVIQVDWREYLEERSIV